MFADVPIPYEEALDRAGHGKLQRWVTFAGAMCLLCSYLAVSMVSFVLPLSQCDLDLTSQGKGAIIASGFIGIILSSHLWGFLSDTLGRRYILMRCLLADGILYILTSFVPNYWLFLIMRLFNGFSSCGGVVSAYAYVGEFHTNKHRTRSIMTASVIATLIYFILPCVAWLICPLEIKVVLFHGLVYKSWRLFYTICGIPSLLTSLLLVLLPESPKFLLANGEKEKAVEVLQYIYAENTGKPAEDFVIMNVVIDDNEKIAQTYGDSKHSIRFLDLMYKQTAPLFKKPLSFNFTLLCTMQFILYFCNNGMFLWIPETINRLAQYRENNPGKPGTFCQAVENYRSTTNNKLTSPYINEFNHTFLKHYEPAMNEFQPDKCDDSVDYSVYINSAVLGLLTGAGVVVIIFVMKMFSRKIVLAGLVMCGATATIIVLFLNHIDYVFPVICIMSVVIGTGIPVVTSILVDFFPTNLRAMAVCISLLTGRLGTIVSSQIVGSVLDTQCNIFLYCFVALLLFCALLVTFLSSSPPTYKAKEKTYEADNVAYQA